MSKRLLVTTIALLVSASLARAAATPISPVPGATLTTAHPVFTWSVPPAERPDGIYIASKPDTTPAGEFYEENIVDRDSLRDGETSWAPTEALWAGTYWWTVSTLHRDTFRTAYSAPSPFTVAGYVRITRLGVERESYTFVPSELNIDVAFASNIHTKTITAAIYRKSKRLWLARTTQTQTFSMDSTQSFEWTRPRKVRRGTPLRLVVTVRGGTAAKTVSRTVRAP